jgi:hypothetical protein
LIKPDTFGLKFTCLSRWYKAHFMKISLYALITLFILGGKPLMAQEHDAENGHHSHLHHHPKNEIGLANNLVYLGEEEEFAYGLHLHYIHNIGDSPFGAGLGYEHIFDDHLHRNWGLVVSYRVLHGLFVNISPGITFIGRTDPEKTFALHLEATYEFELGPVHLGPVFEYALSGHGYHLSGGLHLAYAF